MQASGPRWSPDGTQIAFAAQEPGKPSKIYVVPAAGGVPEQVTTGESNDGDPSWSPDGDELAFGITSPTTTQQRPIQILNLKTREVTALPDSRNYFSPRWSPDGRWLLAFDQDTFEIKLYSFTTRTWEELTKLTAAYPNWSSDSQCVFFNVASGAAEPYYRVCLADRKPELVVNLEDGGQLVSSTFYYWTGVTPDGSILGIEGYQRSKRSTLSTCNCPDAKTDSSAPAVHLPDTFE